MSNSSKETGDISSVGVTAGYVNSDESALRTRDELLRQIENANSSIEALDEKIRNIQKGLDAYENANGMATSEAYAKRWGDQLSLQKEFDRLTAQRTSLDEMRKNLALQLNERKNFDKNVLFANIRTLLKEKTDIKVGQIEKEAGVRLGYTARLEKPENTAEPSIEYVVTAAKMLGVSLDSILKVRLDEMTPTEQYLARFLDKLKADTLQDKLDWQTETPDYLNKITCAINGRTEHPLFSFEEFDDEVESGYPETVRRVVFVSNHFGPRTFIHGKCYKLRMKNESMLYLMDIEKSSHLSSDTSAFAKEIWLFTPGAGSQYLCGTNDGSVLESAASVLFDTVADHVKHPKIKKELKYIMDAFMKDDLEDDRNDDDGDLPF